MNVNKYPLVIVLLSLISGCSESKRFDDDLYKIMKDYHEYKPIVENESGRLMQCDQSFKNCILLDDG